jgi:hypothetical protein
MTRRGFLGSSKLAIRAKNPGRDKRFTKKKELYEELIRAKMDKKKKKRVGSTMEALKIKRRMRGRRT